MSSISLPNNPFFGMEIEHLDSDPNRGLTVETTGAIYKIIYQDPSTGAKSIELIQKIDPVTNTVNPRTVARLEFDTAIGSLDIEFADKRTCILKNSANSIALQFHSDSLFFVSNISVTSLGYVYTNLIPGIGLEKGYKDIHNRLWTDGNGGWLHAPAKGEFGTATIYSDKNSVHFNLAADGQMAHMVFPAKQFDFESLYGANARPFTFFTYNLGQFGAVMEDIGDNEINNPGSSKILSHPFGYIQGPNVFQFGDPRIVWLTSIPELRSQRHLWWRHCPDIFLTGILPALQLLEDPDIIPPSGVYTRYDRGQYQMLTDEERQEVKDHIQTLHEKGLKCLTGFGGWLVYLPETHWDLLFTWLRSLFDEYGFDGIYFDNATYGPINDGAWLDTYNFIRRLRNELGDDIYLFHHNSNDAWGGRGHGGLRAIMVDTYMNATLAGEVGEDAIIDDPCADYLYDYTCGYGFDQTHAHHKRFTAMSGAISEKEKIRVLAQNFNGIERTAYLTRIDTPPDDVLGHWQYFLQYYNSRKAEYASPAFTAGVSWPPGWYHKITEITFDVGSNQVDIRWSTGGDSTDYSVSIIKRDEANQITGNTSVPNNWWQKEDIFALRNETTSSATSTSHLVVLMGLDADTWYKVRIRSSNQLIGTGEEVWGYVGEFKTDL